MSMDKVFGIAGSALAAQLVRMNTTASNLANASNTSETEQGAYKAKRVNFATILEHQVHSDNRRTAGGIRIDEVYEDDKVVPATYQPDNPLADENGFVYPSNVDSMLEMVEITQASRAFESNIEAMNTAKQLASRTLEILKK